MSDMASVRGFVKSPVGAQEKEGCLCWRCKKPSFIFWEDSFQYACPKCGNKRCPHNEWHGFKCTNSNEDGQVGELE